MSVIATAVRHMLASGMSPDVIVSAVADMEAEITAAAVAKEQERLLKQRERTRLSRERRKALDPNAVTLRHVTEHSGNGHAADAVTLRHVSNVTDPPFPETKAPTPLKTQPLSTPKETPSIEGGKKNPKTRSRIVPDWAPSNENLVYARSLGLLETDIRRETEKFRDHHLKTGNAFFDWNAAWRTWCQRVNEFAAPPRMNGHHGTGPPRQKSVITLAAEGMRRRGLLPEKGIEDELFTAGPSLDLTAAKASNS